MLAAPKFQVETRRGVQAFEETSKDKGLSPEFISGACKPRSPSNFASVQKFGVKSEKFAFLSYLLESKKVRLS